MTDVFTAPDDAGPAKASEATTSMVDRLGAQWADTLDPKDSLSGMWLARQAAQGIAGGNIAHDYDVGVDADTAMRLDAIDQQAKASIPDISRDDAKAMVKQEGLSETDVPLGDAPTHKLPVLKMQIAEAHTRRDRQAAIERGPQGFFPDALGLVTSIGVGMIDPVNAAAFSLPVIGEARMGNILASAGDSILARGAARFGQGAAQGAVGTAALQPADWWLHTRDGQDYTMAQGLESVIMGAGMGGAFHAGFGAFGDYARRRQGLPLVGSPADQALRALAGRPDLVPPAEPLPTVAAGEEVPGITPEAQAPAPIFHPGQAIADLPPAARQDAVHAAMADVIADRPVRSAEMLNVAADHDPRIAESMDAYNRAAEVARGTLSDAALEAFTPHLAREAVFDDIHQKLIAAGMDEDEAGYNAALVASRYATRAERLGNAGNAFDLYQSEGLDVRTGDLDEAAGRTHQQRRREAPNLFAQREAEGQNSLPGTERISQGALAQRKADEALKPKVAQKPMDEGLFGDSAAQKSFFQSQPTAPAFYSALGRAVDVTKQEKASPEQWLGMLKNAASVKPEEMKWLGLEDWLRDQKGSVTKQQLQDFISANQIEVKEVAKQDFHHDDARVRIAELMGDLVDSVRSPADVPDVKRFNPTVGAILFGKTDAEAFRTIQEAQAFRKSGVGPTRYRSYALPGGENYREMLLTLPEIRTSKPYDQWLRENYTGVDTQEARDLYKIQLEPSANFKSGHWEEPNILAHARFDDRTSDGKKTLHVAEVQSDWHQTGKRRGYDTGPQWEVVDQSGLARGDTFPTREAAELAAKPWGFEVRQSPIMGRGVPDAPFKTSWPELAMKRMIRYAAENGYDRISWDTGATNADRYDLSRQIQSIRWNETTGDLQAKDHNGEVVLRKTATADELPDIIGKEAAQKLTEQKPEEIKLLPSVHREYLTVEQTEHQYVVTNVDGRKVDIGKGTVGSEAEAKEYAERYLNNSAKEINQRRELEGKRGGLHRTLFGLDLHVGGEGMKGFYDKILPATVGKLVKKFGARVEPGTVGTPRESSHYEGPEPTKAQIAKVAEATSARPTDQRFVSPVTGERQMFQINRAAVEDAMRAVRRAMNGGASFAEAMARHGNHDLAEIFGGKLGQRAGTETDAVHAVDITPELRKAAIQQGFPLFQGGEANPRGRITLGENKAVIDLFKAADKSTFLHETGHLWLDELLRDASRADASEQLRGDRDAVLSWLGVKDAGEIGTAQHEKWAEGFEHYLATAEAPSNALAKAFEAFKQWLLDVYHAVTGLRQEVSPEIRGVVDRLLASDHEIAERRAASEVSKPVAESEPEGVVTKHVKKIPRGRAAADPRTWSLFEYLASKGGLKPDPELHAIFGGKRGPMVGGFGPLLRHAGMTLDDALRSAKDGHYMFDAADVTGNEGRLTLRDLLDLIDQENRKHKVYRNDYLGPEKGVDLEEEARHIRDALHSEIEATTGESGVHVDPELEARVVEIVQKEGVHDVMEAYERAIMEEGERYDAAAEARAADQQDQVIPGWDVPDDARAASARGGASAAPGGQAGSAESRTGGSSGEQPRATRPGDRAPAQAKLKSSHALVAADPRWRELADTTPDYNDPEILAESEEAARTPEPASVDPAKSLSALEKAAADAEEVWRQLEPTLTEDERKAVNEAFANMHIDKDTKDRMIADGVVCLMGAIG